MSDPVYDRLQGVFQSVFGPKIPRISAATTARDIKRWDSLTHLNLVMAVEEAFGTTFSPDEVRGFRTVGDVAALLRIRSDQDATA